jgi:hypothetical protein
MSTRRGRASRRRSAWRAPSAPPRGSHDHRVPFPCGRQSAAAIMKRNGSATTGGPASSASGAGEKAGGLGRGLPSRPRRAILRCVRPRPRLFPCRRGDTPGLGGTVKAVLSVGRPVLLVPEGACPRASAQGPRGVERQPRISRRCPTPFRCLPREVRLVFSGPAGDEAAPARKAVVPRGTASQGAVRDRRGRRKVGDDPRPREDRRGPPGDGRHGRPRFTAGLGGATRAALRRRHRRPDVALNRAIDAGQETATPADLEWAAAGRAERGGGGQPRSFPR